MDNVKRSARWESPLLGSLAVILTCLYPCVFLYAQNAGEANGADMLPFFLLYLGTAALGLLVTGVILRRFSCAAVLTCLGMLAVMNFTLITSAVKRQVAWFQDRYFILLLAVVLLVLLVLFLKKKPDLTALCGIIALTFGVLIGISLMQAVPKLIKTASYRPSEGPPREEVTEFSGEKPNVYYLLFDEYGGEENLETYFGFDNSAFYEALEERGFSLSKTSRNTESCWTDTLVPNLLNLDYVASDSMPEKVRREYLRDPLLTRMFRGNGYQINLINHRAFLRLQGARELTQGQTEDNISEYLFKNSIFCKLPGIKERISQWMFRSYRDNYLGPLENALSALGTCVEEAQEGPTLTVSYIQCPHAPFIFDKGGTVRQDKSLYWYWRDETLYPGQLQYLNTVILAAIDRIQQEDPQGVILLLSDHGARVPLHMVEQFGGPRFDAEQETPVMQNALCGVYIPGKTLDIEGDTCINATRKTLDAVFDTGLGTVTPASGYVLPEIYNAKENTGKQSGSRNEE